MSIQTENSVIILAAGRSKRMGSAKLLLPYNNQETFLDHIIKVYSDFGCKKIVIVYNEYADISGFEEWVVRLKDKITFVINDDLEAGRFYSVQKGLQDIEVEDHIFIHDVDRPFLSVNTLQSLNSSKVSDGYVVPVYNNKSGHPILVGPGVNKHLRNYKRKNVVLHNVLKDFPRKSVGVDDYSIHVNINSLEDYKTHFPGVDIGRYGIK